MEGLELLCFNMISYVGNARSDYIEAIHRAKEGKYEEAQALRPLWKDIKPMGNCWQRMPPVRASRSVCFCFMRKTR